MGLKENFEYMFMRFAVVANNQIFVNFRDAMVRSLKYNGFEAESCKTIDDISLLEKENKVDVVIVINPTINKLPTDKKKLWVAFQTEHLDTIENGGISYGSVNKRRLLSVIHKYDVVVDMKGYNVKPLKKLCKRNANIVKFPYFYYDDLTLKYSNVRCERDKYDIMFLGRLPGVDGRRKHIIEYLQTKYNVAPIRLDLYGENKYVALKESKICLNLHCETSLHEEPERMLDYFANGCFVLSERMNGAYEFVEGEDYDTFYLTNICEKIDYYLANEKERNKMAASANSKLQKLHLNNQIKLIIDACILARYRRQKLKEQTIIKKIVNKCKIIKAYLKKVFNVENNNT